VGTFSFGGFAPCVGALGGVLDLGQAKLRVELLPSPGRDRRDEKMPSVTEVQHGEERDGPMYSPSARGRFGSKFDCQSGTASKYRASRDTPLTPPPTTVRGAL
jgi:hypothetical protein